MSVYLNDIPLFEAKARFDSALRESGLSAVFGVDEIELTESAVGRVLKEPVWAKISSPNYNAAAMDGFAVKASDTVGALPNNPIFLSCSEDLLIQKALYVDTGDPLPGWADAVIPVENIEPLNKAGTVASNPRRPSTIKVRSPIAPWQYIRPLGEDIVATQLVLPPGHTIRPVDLGAIAACGYSQVSVVRKPRVAVIPTGSELIPIGHLPARGEIIDYNSVVLAAQITEWGGIPKRYPIVRDDFDEIRNCVYQASQENDLVLLNAGSSSGSEDFSAKIIQTLGDILVHGVAVRPGHPVILGMIHVDDNQSSLNKQVPIIGVPGYPVSAALTGEIFVEPLLTSWLGKIPKEPVTIEASLTKKITSPPGDDDYLRVSVGVVGEDRLAIPLPRGSGVISSLARADGIVIIPRGVQGLAAGDKVRVRLYRTQSEIEHTIVVIGSHDFLLDLLALRLYSQGIRLISANIGSLGGLYALRRREAHLAGSHLLDPETGVYNIKYIHQYLPGIAVKVVRLAERQQGLIVAKNNPKEIEGLSDLTRSEITFVNRQRGAGTRVLLDYHLDQLGISPNEIHGYDQEEYTHLTVAAAVEAGRADCGLGIAAAAQALHLTFIPLYNEQYDLIVPVEHFSSPKLEMLLGLLSETTFREECSLIPGYDVISMGEIVYESD